MAASPSGENMVRGDTLTDRYAAPVAETPSMTTRVFASLSSRLRGYVPALAVFILAMVLHSAAVILLGPKLPGTFPFFLYRLAFDGRLVRVRSRAPGDGADHLRHALSVQAGLLDSHRRRWRSHHFLVAVCHRQQDGRGPQADRSAAAPAEPRVRPTSRGADEDPPRPTG